MNNETKRKSISLILIIFIILLIVALVILLSKVFQNNEDDEVSNNSGIEISVNTSSENITNSTDYDDISFENSTESNLVTNDTNIALSTNNSTENTTTSNSTTNTEPKTLTLNGHNYKIKNSLEATLVQNNNSSAIQTIYPDYNYKMIFNTSNNTNFADLKSNSDLKNYLESTFDLKITSTIKSGNINNLNIILFTISDSIGNGYCVFTSLNDTEIAYAKLYDTSDSSKLISDLSTPLANISELIASMEN